MINDSWELIGDNYHLSPINYQLFQRSQRLLQIDFR